MITAVVLAAGVSRRMGRPKMLLPWGETTVIRRVVDTLIAAGLDEVVVVTGELRAEVEAALSAMPARVVYNPEYRDGEMLRSFQEGLAVLGEKPSAALVALGDQPQIEAAVVRAVLDARLKDPLRIVVPSYRQRRGHPWLLPRAWWDEVRGLRAPATLRDFLNAHAADIEYVAVDSPGILQDLDTPDDYARSQP